MKGCKGVGEKKICSKKFGVANVLCSHPEYASDWGAPQAGRKGLILNMFSVLSIQLFPLINQPCFKPRLPGIKS